MLFVIVTVTFLIFITTQLYYSVAYNTENDIKDNGALSLEDEDTQEFEVKFPEIKREAGYNSIRIKFKDSSNTGIPMDISIAAVYNTEEAVYNLADAMDNKLIRSYTQEADTIEFLLKTGIKFNFTFTPVFKSEVIGWDDAKANYPMEVEATSSGDCKLTNIEIALDYASSTVRASKQIELYD